MEIEQAAAAFTAALADVPAHSRSMHIVSSWADAGEGQPKKLVKEIHVAFKSPYQDRAVPSEFMGHVVKKVAFAP